jgi:hypothetical protein
LLAICIGPLLMGRTVIQLLRADANNSTELATCALFIISSLQDLSTLRP